MIDTSIIESPRRDTSPQVYAGLPAQAYVPNPYDFGRPAIVYPGDSVYYSAPEPHDKARAADTVLDAVRRTACAYMNQALRVSPAQAAAMEAGIQYGWSDPAQIRRTIPLPVIIAGSNAAHGGIAYGETAEAEPELFDVGC